MTELFQGVPVDPTRGEAAASGYDCRADTTNDRKTRFFAAVSSDGGQTFSSNAQLESGQSDVSLIDTDKYYPNVDYFDYTGLAYYGGSFYSAWADNSDSSGAGNDNPDVSAGMDVYVAKVEY